MKRSITLSLLKYLEDNGLGTIDENLFWEKLGVGKNGIYITDVGTSQERGIRPHTNYELFSRADDDLMALLQLQKVCDFLATHYSTCRLPAVPPWTDTGFSNVTIMPPSTPTNAGEDTNGHIIYNASGQIYF